MMNSKKVYDPAEIDVISMEMADIITKSPGWGFEEENDNNVDSNGWT